MTPDIELERFLKRYDPEVAETGRRVLAAMLVRVPGAMVLVYDNHNALAMALSPTERSSDAVFSIAVYPRWLSLFFANATRLPDPDRTLEGNGKKMRHVKLRSIADWEAAPVQRLIDAALAQAPKPFTTPGKIVLKSIAQKQRPRRPEPE